MTDPAVQDPGPHRRLNPLTGDWVLVSAQRTQRPWQGSTERLHDGISAPAYDPNCYLCPGNPRAGGTRNPDYSATYAFTNDFPALLPEASRSVDADPPLFQTESASGTCRVLCFSPDHGKTLAELDASRVRSVIDLWATQTAELGQTHAWVQVFENKGDAMGASNPHPHGQVWASAAVPSHVVTENRRQANYRDQHGVNLLLDYGRVESERNTRVVAENDRWVAVVPFWATWPFEMLILPKRHVLRFPDLADAERDDLADVLKLMLTRADNLFETPFPYSMGWHGAPFNGDPDDHWQLHGHVYPPLLRSASVRKFMVGYELLGEAQRDLTPEDAAQRLRSQSPVHYRTAQPSHVT